MKSLREQRSYYARQLIYIERIKRLHDKFTTLDGYIYCVGDEGKFKRRLTEINIDLEIYENQDI